jgi:OB-fold nucleic acid binding domain
MERLARPPEDLRAENLRKWVASVPEATLIRDVQARTRCRIAGVIQNIRIDPREGHGSIEATIIDGTGEMVVKWLGRPSKSGIRLGMGLVVDGTVGRAPGGELQVLNPEYKLVVGPEHG